MLNLIFVARAFLITLVILFLLQVPIGSDTLEDKTMYYLQDSSAVGPLREVALGAVTLVSQGYGFVIGHVKKTVRDFTSTEENQKNRKPSN